MRQCPARSGAFLNEATRPLKIIVAGHSILVWFLEGLKVDYWLAAPLGKRGQLSRGGAAKAHHGRHSTQTRNHRYKSTGAPCNSSFEDSNDPAVQPPDPTLA
jgi:hypothetical protein